MCCACRGYGGVSEARCRQRVKAIECAYLLALQCDGQYITGVNDDVVPMKLFLRDFDFDKCVALRLSDKSPEDKLFGFELKKDGGEESSNEEGSDE